MILQIYKAMLATAQTLEVPKYIELTYHIDKEQSKEFWADKSLKKEHKLLLDEWDSEGKSKYKKTFYGIKFAIQFNYSNN
jgi:hypothetical protein